MANALPTGCVAECYWAGVEQDDLRDLDLRIGASVAAFGRDGEPVRYLG